MKEKGKKLFLVKKSNNENMENNENQKNMRLNIEMKKNSNTEENISPNNNPNINIVNNNFNKIVMTSNQKKSSKNLSNNNYSNNKYNVLNNISQSNLFNNNMNMNNLNLENKNIYNNNRQREQSNLFFKESNNLFNCIRNTNSLLFDHSFINEKTLEYISFLEEAKKLNTVINLFQLIENRKGFEEFQLNYDWEYYELILMLATGKMYGEIFEKYNEFILNYLYNGMEKLNDINFLDSIKSNERYCCEKLFTEMRYYYFQKSEDFKRNSDREYKLNCITDTKNFLCSCFIYYKLQKGKQLDFTEYRLNKTSIQPLLNTLKFKENIIELNFTNNDIGKEGCFCLGNLLKMNKNLSILNLSFCKIDNMALKFLLKGLKYKSASDKYNLTQLILCDNNITNEEGGEYLGIILEHFNKLQWLNLSDNKINNKGAVKLFQAYKQIISTQNSFNNPSFNNGNTINFYDNSNLNLNISINRQSNSNGNNQRPLHSLETLLLIGIGIYSEECLTILGDIIRNPRCGLKTLALSKNNVGISNPYNHPQSLKDIKYFLHSFEENKTITELLLLSCKIGNDTTEEIYNMLKINKSLEYLVLYNNDINQQSVFLKLLSLFSDSSLNNGITNNTLKFLDLSKNNCPIEINKRFLTIIEELQLSSLDISQNKLSSEGSDNFKNLANRIGDKLKIIY